MNDFKVIAYLKVRQALNLLAMVRNQSKLKIAVIAVFATGFWTLLFALFFKGFSFIYGRVPSPDLAATIIDYLFALFFLSLLVMLSFSNGIILYTSMFRSSETDYLFSMPMGPANLFAYKFVESLAFASWAVLLLGTPLLVAYGIRTQVPWYFYPGAVTLLVPFVVLSGAIGNLVTFTLVGLATRFSRLVFVLLVALAGGLIAFVALKVAGAARSGTPFSSIWSQEILANLSFTQSPLLPSLWMSQGIVFLALGETPDALFHGLMLAANALFFFVVGYRLAGWAYSGVYARVAAVGSRRRATGAPARRERAAGLVARAFAFLPRRTRIFLEKDLKSFLRDPVQYSQFVILIGLLAIYILNLRTLNYHTKSLYWKSLVAFLNLCATALTMTTFASRFVYPLLSLEGRRFWILGVVPMSRQAILNGKFVFAFVSLLVVSEVLILTSCTLLAVPWSLTLLHGFVLVLLCVGISGLSVGLGARFPVFEEEDPSKIVSGFGGTLTLLLTMAYIFTMIVLLALPMHLKLAGWSLPMSALWVPATIAAGIVLAAVVCVVPLRLGLAHFQRLEL